MVVLQYQAGQPPGGGTPRGHLVYATSSVDLFADLDTREDAVIYRADPTGYRLARQTIA